MSGAHEGEALTAFVRDLGAALAGAAAATPDADAATTLGGFADITRSLAPGPRERSVPGPVAPLPVCRFWDAAIAGAREVSESLVAALATLGPALTWTQNPNYRRQPPDGRFLDDYGYAVIAGPASGPPALVVDPRLALGVLLLGPGTHYPLHRHPATEVYYTLSADGEWWRGAGPWRRAPAGTAIHHPPNLPHATRAGDGPLLAVYLWRGALETHARLTTADARDPC